jgi:PAS domain S-box-containing protein
MPKLSPAPLKLAFGKALLDLRKRRGRDAPLSQEALARLAGMAPDYIGDLERGRHDPTFSTLVRLAEALHTDPSRLVREAWELYREYRNTVVHIGPAALTKEMRQLRDWIERSPDLFWFCDPQHKCLFANTATLEWMGVTPDQVLSDAWRDFIHPDDHEDYLKFSDRKFRRREPYVSIYRVRRFDGQYIRVLQRANPQFTSKGHFYGFLGAMVPDPTAAIAAKAPSRPLTDYFDPDIYHLHPPKSKKKRAQSSEHNSKS